MKLCITDLPIELIDYMLLYLDLKDIVSCYRSNKCFCVVSIARWERMYKNTHTYALIRCRSLAGIRFKINKMGILIDDAIFNYSILLNCKNIIDYFIENNFEVKSQHLNYAIRNNCIDIAECLHVKWCVVFDIYSPFTAIRYCSLFNIKRLNRIGLEYNNDCIEIAAKRNGYDIVKYLYNSGFREMVIINSVHFRNINITKLLLKYKTPNININIGFNLAVRVGNLDVMKLLYNHGAFGTEYALQQAASYNYTDIMRYLYFINIPIQNRTLNIALKNGCSLESCRYLMAIGLRCEKSGLNSIARLGNIEIMRYLLCVSDVKFSRNELNILDIAIIFGNIELVRYLNGLGLYPIHGVSLHRVILDKDIELFKLLTN